jgi:hypothetical protein
MAPKRHALAVLDVEGGGIHAAHMHSGRGPLHGQGESVVELPKFDCLVAVQRHGRIIAPFFARYTGKPARIRNPLLPGLIDTPAG